MLYLQDTLLYCKLFFGFFMHINVFSKVDNYSCISVTDMDGDIHILYMGEEPFVIPVLVINPRYRPAINLNRTEDLLLHKYIKERLDKSWHWILADLRRYDEPDDVECKCLYFTISAMRTCVSIALAHAHGIKHPQEHNPFLQGGRGGSNDNEG